MGLVNINSAPNEVTSFSQNNQFCATGIKFQNRFFKKIFQIIVPYFIFIGYLLTSPLNLWLTFQELQESILK